MARMPFLILLLFVPGLGHCPGRDVFEVDMLEVNVMHDRQANPVYTQIIAWQIMPEDGRIHNVGWRMVSSWLDMPQRRGKVWAVVGYDTRRVIRVTAPLLRRSWTQVDPERVDARDYWRGNAPNIFKPLEGAGRDSAPYRTDASDE